MVSLTFVILVSLLVIILILGFYFNKITLKSFLIILILMIIFIILFLYILNLCIFCAPQIEENKYSEILKFYNKETIDIKTSNSCRIHGILLNNNKLPSYNDKIFLYSHGNACSLVDLFDSRQIEFLSIFGSVFIYDYNGYGVNSNIPSEEQCYDDIMSVWKFLTLDKKVKPENIIIYGHSLGTSISSKLVSNLHDDKKELPKALILESPFSSISEMGHSLLNGMGYLMSGFDNINNLNNIKGKLPILVMHSKKDEIIPYQQSQTIKNNTNCDFIEIDGYHSSHLYNTEVFKYLNSLTND